MTETKSFCDLCGSEIISAGNYLMRFSHSEPHEFGTPGFSTHQFDVCNQCTREILRVIDKPVPMKDGWFLAILRKLKGGKS